MFSAASLQRASKDPGATGFYKYQNDQFEMANIKLNFNFLKTYFILEF